MKVFSCMEVFNVETGERTPLFEREGRFEAPNWHRDGFLVYNQDGLIRTYHVETGEHGCIDTGSATHCNNDHVLSADGKYLAISHSEETDWHSRIYILPITGGEPRKVTDNTATDGYHAIGSCEIVLYHTFKQVSEGVDIL